MIGEYLTLQRTLVSIDIESTSNVVESARIVELGLVIISPDGSVKEWSALMNPQEPIPAESTAIHGITNEDVADKPTFAQYAPNLLRGLSACDFVCYNGRRFDLPLLRNEFQRSGHTWSYAEAAVLDAFRVWQIAAPRSLDDALKELATDEENLELDGKAHRALRDAKASVLALKGLLRKYPALPRDVRALHDKCSPDQVDEEGKFVWRNGEAVFNFGKQKNVRLRDVDKGYLRYMIRPGNTFSPTVRQIVADALRGQYPVQVPTSTPEE